MSKLNELNISNNIIATVDNFRYFITCGNEVSEDTEKLSFFNGLYGLFGDLPPQARFSIARELLDEIDKYRYAFSGNSLKMDQWRTVFYGLLNSFKHYEGIERVEYARLLEVAPAYVVDKLISNRSFPLDFLLDSSLLEKHKSHSIFQELETEVRYAKAARKLEIVAHCRGAVPNSAHMSDDMVLSVAGIDM